jgi:hypothetical protein
MGESMIFRENPENKKLLRLARMQVSRSHPAGRTRDVIRNAGIKKH